MQLTTTAPALPTVLYDGHCRFCIAQMRNLARLLPDGKYQTLSFQEDGVLERFPGVTHDEAMKEMKLIDGRGRVYGGMEAAVRAVALRPWWRFAYLYYVPGIRQLLDWIYRLIARNRYKLMGKCDEGTCALHIPPR